MTMQSLPVFTVILSKKSERHSALPGVKAISAHVPVAELLADTGATVATYKAVGVKYIVIPYAPEDMRPGVADDYDEVIKKIAYIGRICGEQGIQLLYHNHDFEFVKMPDGSYGLDYLYSHLPAEYLQTELDLCWVKVSGLDPVEYSAEILRTGSDSSL